MQKMVCEMCSGNEFVKQDGFFVCQSCGTKYTPDEARKLIIEGTVKIDDSDEIQRLYKAARNARETGDSAAALKHYETIGAKDPDSWEALFYSVVLKTDNITNGEISNAAVSIKNCLAKVLELVKENVSDENERRKAVKEISAVCLIKATSLCSASHSFYSGVTKGNTAIALTGVTGAAMSQKYTTDALREDSVRCFNIAQIMYTLGNLVESLFDMNDNEYKNIALTCWKDVLDRNADFKNYHKSAINAYLFTQEFVDTVTNQIHKYDPTYQPAMKGAAPKKKTPLPWKIAAIIIAAAAAFGLIRFLIMLISSGGSLR